MSLCLFCFNPKEVINVRRSDLDVFVSLLWRYAVSPATSPHIPCWFRIRSCRISSHRYWWFHLSGLSANMLGIAVIDANQIKRHLEYEEKRQERVASDYAKLHKCKHCYECRLCSLMGYKNCCTASACTAAYKRAYEYALSRIRERQETWKIKAPTVGKHHRR